MRIQKSQKFQFQDGTIKSDMFAKEFRTDPISIPRWYD